MYSSRDGAARSVLTLSLPSWYVTPREERLDRVAEVDFERLPDNLTARSVVSTCGLCTD